MDIVLKTDIYNYSKIWENVRHTYLGTDFRLKKNWMDDLVNTVFGKRFKKVAIYGAKSQALILNLIINLITNTFWTNSQFQKIPPCPCTDIFLLVHVSSLYLLLVFF